MRKTLKVNESSVMYRKIDELVMSEMDRTQAVGALKAADRLADAYDGLKRIISDRKSTRLNSSHIPLSRMPSSA